MTLKTYIKKLKSGELVAIDADELTDWLKTAKDTFKNRLKDFENEAKSNKIYIRRHHGSKNSFDIETHSRVFDKSELQKIAESNGLEVRFNTKRLNGFTVKDKLETESNIDKAAEEYTNLMNRVNDFEIRINNLMLDYNSRILMSDYSSKNRIVYRFYRVEDKLFDEVSERILNYADQYELEAEVILHDDIIIKLTLD